MDLAGKPRFQENFELIVFTLLGGMLPPGAGPPTCFALFWAVYPHLLVSYRTGTEQHPCCQPLARHPCLAFRTSLHKLRRPQRRTFNQRHFSLKETSLGAFTLNITSEPHLLRYGFAFRKVVKALSSVISISVFLVFSAPVASHGIQKRADRQNMDVLSDPLRQGAESDRGRREFEE